MASPEIPRRSHPDHHDTRKSRREQVLSTTIKNTGFKSERRRDLSVDLYAKLREVVTNLLEIGLVYEDPYHMANVDDKGDTDSSFMHLYVMNIGNPGDPHKKPAKRKTLTAYAGASVDPVVDRVAEHNNGAAEIKNPKTRDGISRWTLCIVIFIPKILRDHVTTKLLKHYLVMAHGIKGKLLRCYELIKMFNLRYYIPPERREYVHMFSKNRCEIDNAPFAFKSPAILKAEDAARSPPGESQGTLSNRASDSDSDANDEIE